MYNTKDYQLNGEVWKDTPNYEGIYQASSFGRIRTIEGKTTHTILHGIRHWKPKIIKPKGETYATGYRVSLWKDGKLKDWLISRLICTTFHGYSNLTVNHIDGNRFNNNINNLEWLSLADNIRAGFETGLYPQKSCELILNGICKTFRSLSLAGRYLGRNNNYISACVKGNRQPTSRDGVKYLLRVA